MTMRDMWLRKHGKQLLVGLVVALSILLSCRSSKPAPMEICIIDGLGGGDCVEADGTRKYRLPSQMTNYWATNQQDEAAFASWCYNAPVGAVKSEMEHIQGQLAR